MLFQNIHTGVVSYLCNKRGENVATKSWFNPRTSEHLLDPLFIELPDHQCSTQFSDSSGTLASLIRKCLGIPPHLTHIKWLYKKNSKKRNFNPPSKSNFIGGCWFVYFLICIQIWYDTWYVYIGTNTMLAFHV